MEIKKKEGETTTSLIYRFSKKVRQSGLIREVKKRRFTSREVNKTKRKASALYRSERAVEIKRLRKLGKI